MSSRLSIAGNLRAPRLNREDGSKLTSLYVGDSNKHQHYGQLGNTFNPKFILALTLLRLTISGHKSVSRKSDIHVSRTWQHCSRCVFTPGDWQRWLMHSPRKRD